MSIYPHFAQAWKPLSAYVIYVKSAYVLGGYEIIPNVGIDLDPEGMEWVRTFNLRHTSGLEFRIIHPDDLHVLIGEHPSEAEVIRMYGKPVQHEGVCLQYYRRPSGWMPREEE